MTPCTHNVEVELCGGEGSDDLQCQVSELHHIDKGVIVVGQTCHNVFLEAGDGRKVRLILGREGGRGRDGGGGREGGRGREGGGGREGEGGTEGEGGKEGEGGREREGGREGEGGREKEERREREGRREAPTVIQRSLTKKPWLPPASQFYYAYLLCTYIMY